MSARSGFRGWRRRACLSEFAAHREVLRTEGVGTLSSEQCRGFTEEDGGSSQVRRVKKGGAGRRNGIVRGAVVDVGWCR